MDSNLNLSEASLPVITQRRIDEICARFESQWKSGVPPQMHEFLAEAAPDEQHELLEELLSLDDHYRRQSGNAASDADYIAQYPDHAETIREYFGARAESPQQTGQGKPHQSPLPMIPGFAVERELGRGGMGVVYLAVQDRPRRHVVLKMIRDGALAHPAAIRRFQVEAQAVARLQHPNIVQVHAVGEHEGRPYMVLEYIAGGGLDRRLDGKPVNPRDAAFLVEQLADAVHYAHQQGVIHRDLKPANVLIADGEGQTAGQNDEGGRGTSGIHSAIGQLQSAIKIADFGLAKLLEEELGPVTMTGETVGTPSYMAPEQARGKSQEVCPATDVYALGAILYQLITGRPPFVGINAITTLEQVTSLDPAPPRQLQPQVPRDLNTICLKCLEKSSALRYPSALALAEDLRRFRAGVPIQARAVSRVERMIRWSRRYPAAAGLMAALFLGLATTIALLVRLELAQRNVKLANEKANLNLVNAQESVRKSLVFLVEDEEMIRKGLFDLRLRMLSTITEQVESMRAQNDDKLLMARDLASAYLRMSSLQQQLGQLAKTGQSIELAMNLFQQLTANDPDNKDYRSGLAGCYFARGVYYRNEYRHDNARADFQQSATIYKQIVSERPNDIAARRKLTDVLVASGDQEQVLKDNVRADSFFREALASALEWARRNPNDGKAFIAQAKSQLGLSEVLMATQQDHSLAEASECVRRAAEAMNHAFDLKPDDVAQRLSIATAYLNLSRQAIACKLFPDAESILIRGATTLERLCAEFPTAQSYWLYLSQTNFRLGSVYRSLGRVEDEDAARRKSFAAIDELVKSGPITLATQHRSGTMSMVRYYIEYLIRIKKLDEAMQCINRADQMNEIIFGPDRRKLNHDSQKSGKTAPKSVFDGWHCQLEMDRATVHDAAGRFRESIAAWDRSIQLHTSFPNIKRVGRGLALAGAGDFEAALTQANEVATEKQLTATECYDLARTYSRCCKATLPVVRREEISKSAIAFLNKALAKGHFDTPDAVELLSSDPDLEPVRQRTEFVELLKKLKEKPPATQLPTSKCFIEHTVVSVASAYDIITWGNVYFVWI